jgi:hypothetical protein
MKVAEIRRYPIKSLPVWATVERPGRVAID